MITYLVLMFVFQSCEGPFDDTSGTFTDKRDNHEYRWVKIGDQIWMAENLAYLPEVHDPPNGSTDEPRYYVPSYEGTNKRDAKATKEYKIYGVLYNYVAAKKSCPKHWHLPSDDEWKELEMFIGMDPSECERKLDYHLLDTGIIIHDDGWRGTIEGKKLKSQSGWNENGNGTDEYGFNALPAGYRCKDEYSCTVNITFNADFWTSTENNFQQPYSRGLDSAHDDIYRYFGNNFGGISVRCVLNN